MPFNLPDIEFYLHLPSTFMTQVNLEVEQKEDEKRSLQDIYYHSKSNFLE